LNRGNQWLRRVVSGSATRSSKEKFQTKLDLTSRVGRSDGPKGRPGEEVGSAQDRCVGHVDELSGKLQAGPLAEHEALGDVQISRREPRSAEGTDRAVAKVVQSRIFNRVRIPELLAELPAA